MERSARRRFLGTLAGVAAAAVAPARGAEGQPLEPLIRKVTGGAPLREGRVQLTLPRLADNGHSVPLRVVVDAPGGARGVRSITLLSSRNPRPVIATFHLGPAAGRPEIVTRVRLNGTQRVLAIAALADGSYWSGAAEVEVTESACLDAG